MKLFGMELRKASKKELSSIPRYSQGTGSFLSLSNDPMKLSTVFRCVDAVSKGVATLPMEVYKVDNAGFKELFKTHPAYDLLRLEPNSDMTMFTFMKTIVVSLLLNGNGYAYIDRDDYGRPIELVYIHPSRVQIVWITDSNGIDRKRYQVAGFFQLVEPKDMLHFMNFTNDGITGISTIAYAAQQLGIAIDSETHAAGFFKGGANTAGILTVEGRMSAEQKKQNYEAWEARTNSATGKSNGIVILEGNMKYQPNSISPKDSQLLESRQFNVIEICRFFSVSPVIAFDLSKSSYSTIEATQLSFLTDTIAPFITSIEQEIQRKLFLPSERGKVTAEFDTTAFLRADKAAQATYIQTMFNIGALTPNEARRESNRARLDNGDSAFVQVNVQTLEKAVAPVPDPSIPTV